MHRWYMICMGRLFIVLLELTRLVDAGFCGPLNRCTCTNSLMDCRSQSLSAFPNAIPKHIRAMYLDDNLLTDFNQIPKGAQLELLTVRNNEISSLNYNTFDNMDALTSLYLGNNTIKVIGNDAFKWNSKKLEILHLDSNKLQYIGQFTFYDLEELSTLYLQNNDIVFIHPNAFLQLKNLKSLRLDGNGLRTFNYKWIDKLQANMFSELRFDNNPWSCDCAMSYSLTWLAKMKSKWFHELADSYSLTCAMPLSVGGMSFKDLDKRQIMRQCDLPVIMGISKPITLRPTQTVKLQCLARTETYPFPTISWIAPNMDVYRLNTAINYYGITVGIDGSLIIANVSAIDHGPYACNASNVIGSHTAMTSLSVIGTPPTGTQSTMIVKSTLTDPVRTAVIRSIRPCPESCQCISRDVDCSGDDSDEYRIPRKAVPDGIPSDAVTISLAGNQLERVNSSDFKTFTHLEELRLDNNLISKIDYHAFNALRALRTLDLKQNLLGTIADRTFFKLRRLCVLVLDHNRLTNITKRMFQGLQSLQLLYLRHNDIKSLDMKAFERLFELRFIHLEANQLLKITPDCFSLAAKFPSLMKIFVDDNDFQCHCEMENVRLQIQSQQFKAKHQNFFGAGIICSNPELFGIHLETVQETLTCNDKVPKRCGEASEAHSSPTIGRHPKAVAWSTSSAVPICSTIFPTFAVTAIVYRACIYWWK